MTNLTYNNGYDNPNSLKYKELKDAIEKEVSIIFLYLEIYNAFITFPLSFLTNLSFDGKQTY